jgi:hypothetical protein
VHDTVNAFYACSDVRFWQNVETDTVAELSHPQAFGAAVAKRLCWSELPGRCGAVETQLGLLG